MLTEALAAAAALAAGTVWVGRRADLREAAAEARYPPLGEMVEVDGRVVHVVTRGRGPDLVLIHGAGGNARDFTWAFANLLSDRYRVHVPDRPGLGWSAPLDPRDDGPRAQARHLARALGALGVEMPLVLGHSYGGAVAMAWALEARAAGLILLAGATMPWPGPLRPYYRIFGSPLIGPLAAPLVSAFASPATVEKSVADVFAPAPTPPGYIAGAAIPLATRTRHFRTSARQVAQLRPHLVGMRPHYPGLDLPVELLHGTADTSVRAEVHSEPLAALLPRATLTLLPGIGHAPHHVVPDTVAAAIDRAARAAGLP